MTVSRKVKHVVGCVRLDSALIKAGGINVMSIQNHEDSWPDSLLSSVKASEFSVCPK
jgi:hypothetical protein